MSPAPSPDDAPVPLSDRARAVLYAVVTEFIDTGEPVGSRTLSTRHGLELSSATIRNVLKDLEEAGYLLQPHTSAGRVPTLAAFRLFIDALMRIRALPAVQEGQIRELFAQQLAPAELLRESGRLLSELSGQPAVIVRARPEGRALRRVRFVPSQPGELLAVLILDDGSVENRFIRAPQGLELGQLERLHNLIDEVTHGRTLAELSRYLGELARRDRDELGALGRLGDQLVGPAAERAVGQREVIVEGRSTLVSGGLEPGRLRELLLALDDREQVAVLLDRTLRCPDVQVFLGDEGAARPGSSPLSVVAAPYAAAGVSAGVVGTVGPRRMDYPALVPLVATVARALTQCLGGSQPGLPPEGSD